MMIKWLDCVDLEGVDKFCTIRKRDRKIDHRLLRRRRWGGQLPGEQPLLEEPEDLMEGGRSQELRRRLLHEHSPQAEHLVLDLALDRGEPVLEEGRVGERR